MRARIVDFALSLNRKQRVTFELDADFRSLFDKLHEQDVELTVKKYSESRTNKANAYLWALLNEIGNVLRESKEDIYLDMLKQYGQGGAVSVDERFEDNFRRTYKYNEYLGASSLNGKLFKHYRFWVGSSEYSREEFSILLDGVIREAQNLGIETKTKEEIESLLRSYEL